MADLRPIGSEKLEGVDKLRRIMEIATYKETPKTELNNLSTTNYTIQLSDGNFYGIVKERQGYIIKTGVNESNMDYSDPMKNRKYYRSFFTLCRASSVSSGIHAGFSFFICTRTSVTFWFRFLLHTSLVFFTGVNGFSITIINLCFLSI